MLYNFLITVSSSEGYKIHAGEFFPVSGDTEMTAFMKVYKLVTGDDADKNGRYPVWYWRLWKDEPL